ncbi:hypothetical protein Q7472_05110 [Glaesserella parasuis]|uniref:hypothetical protein n=1 Tax=Glaesserella parasuis TaxID=738 RepID=UPI0013667D6C|nr:hypothetical protein [Glaesserella parasuis]MDE4031146.1 hypothetical protein [Glaesserella parasuis]MDG6355263.1 hypothetical protein [Glaesserella parasuis]MDO9747467.1 hypothetical protein [Glaesserella parasuis]MDO9771657.1 hypothetical protein [Glaesserella parasuis]MDO9773847.1 hypothetical protein [Glaesserella parasuis]
MKLSEDDKANILMLHLFLSFYLVGSVPDDYEWLVILLGLVSRPILFAWLYSEELKKNNDADRKE